MYMISKRDLNGSRDLGIATQEFNDLRKMEKLQQYIRLLQRVLLGALTKVCELLRWAGMLGEHHHTELFSHIPSPLPQKIE